MKRIMKFEDFCKLSRLISCSDSELRIDYEKYVEMYRYNSIKDKSKKKDFYKTLEEKYEVNKKKSDFT